MPLSLVDIRVRLPLPMEGRLDEDVRPGLTVPFSLRKPVPLLRTTPLLVWDERRDEEVRLPVTPFLRDVAPLVLVPPETRDPLAIAPPRLPPPPRPPEVLDPA